MNNKNSIKNKLLSTESIPTLIISTILAFIVGKVFDPILTYFYAIFLNIGGGFIKYISDSTYRQISNGFSEQSSMLVLYILYLSAWGAFGYISSSLHIAHKLYINHINELEQKLNLGQNIPVEGSDGFEISCNEQIQDSTENNKNEIQSEINSLRNKVKKDFFITILPLIACMLFLMFTYSKTSFINKKITVLTNNIDIVSPYISDSEYKKLKSDFHSINDSDDYFSLLSRLNAIADKNSIKLKE